MKKAWWKEAVVYQIYPRSFNDSNSDGIGDINGIIDKLDYLIKLGVNVIWLSPVYKSPNNDNGYDVSDYRKIMDDFGTMDDFDRMLEKAHLLGLKVVMDLVVNHTSDEHLWFQESRKSKDNPYRNYYIWKDPVDGHEPNNWGSCFGGSAWKYDETTGQYFLHLFSEKQPDLNWDNQKVREEVYSLMRFWLNKGVDGFRMDVISLISKQFDYRDGVEEINGYTSFCVTANGPRVHEYLQEMRSKVLESYDTLTVGECAGVTVEEAKKYAASDGSELSMVFQFEHMEIDSEINNKWKERKKNLVELKEIMSKWQNELEGIAWNSLYWGNHDQPRIVSRWGNDTEEYREISAKMLATCLHMMQGTPYIYQGEELGMTNMPFETLENFRDLDSINAFNELVIEKQKMTVTEMMDSLRKKSRDNARTPIQWDDSQYAGFSSNEPWIQVNPNYKFINASYQINQKDSVLSYYQKLILLRKTHPIIVYGHYELLELKNQKLFIYTRSYEGKKLLIVCNFTKDNVPYSIPDEFKDAKCLIANYKKERISDILRPYETYVLMI